jgi:hypothetical protein
VSPPADLDELSPAQLKELVVLLFAKLAGLERTNAGQRGKITRLKGLKGRPDIKPGKPGGMEKATEPANPAQREKHRRRGKVRPRVVVADRIIAAAAPAGSRFKGCETDQVQEPVLSVHAVRHRRERGVTADGQTIVAPLPEATKGHFGPTLRRFVLMQSQQGPDHAAPPDGAGALGRRGDLRTPDPAATDKEAGWFPRRQPRGAACGAGNLGLVPAGDSGAWHKAENGFGPAFRSAWLTRRFDALGVCQRNARDANETLGCTQIGNDRLTWFGTPSAKSRLNFLHLRRAGYTDYALNEAAFDDLPSRGLACPLIARLAEAGETRFANKARWQAHLTRLGIVPPSKAGVAVIQEPGQIATEGVQSGSIQAHGFLREAVLLSGEAGQFAAGRHALCRAHAQRLVHKLDSFADLLRAAQKSMRGLIRKFYPGLKICRNNPGKRRRFTLPARFDRLFRRRTGFVTLDRRLARLWANKAELPMVLERPEIPLHSNGSENDSRCQLTRRKVSAGTRSDAAGDCRDAFPGLAKTCAKHAVAFRDYLGSRLSVPGQTIVPPLPQLVRCRGQPP